MVKYRSSIGSAAFVHYIVSGALATGSVSLRKRQYMPTDNSSNLSKLLICSKKQREAEWEVDYLCFVYIYEVIPTNQNSKQNICSCNLQFFEVENNKTIKAARGKR